MISRITYVLREMWASLTRNLTLTIAAVVTATVSLFLFGLSLLIQRAFDNQLQRWSGGVEMVVYVNAGAPADQVALIDQTLERQKPTLVKTLSYCDVACSLDEAQRLLAGSPETLAELTESSIPTSFKVTPATPDDTALLQRVQESFSGLPGVKEVVYPSDQIEVLEKLKGIVGLRTLVFAVILLGASVLLIWNTIRTAMFARRREIEVMKLVGATNWFIRIPFMLEGLLQGLVGAGLASALLGFANANWSSAVRTFPFEAGLSGFVITSTPWGTMALMTLVGALVGAIGSGTAASRFLDV
jgi:cell division transport system permease protein